MPAPTTIFQRVIKNAEQRMFTTSTPPWYHRVGIPLIQSIQKPYQLLIKSINNYNKTIYVFSVIDASLQLIFIPLNQFDLEREMRTRKEINILTDNPIVDEIANFFLYTSFK